MSRFRRFDGEVYDADKDNMGVCQDKQPINLHIDIDRIVCVRDHYDDKDGYSGCIIYLDSGDDFWSPMDTEEVLKIVNEGTIIK